MVDGFELREQSYYDLLRKVFSAAKHDSNFFQIIVDAPFKDPLSATYIELSTLMLFTPDIRNSVVQAQALSSTDQGKAIRKLSDVVFEQLVFPFSKRSNAIANAITAQSMSKTDNWGDLLMPIVSADSARFIQSGVGVACSIVAPLKLGNLDCALVFNFFKQGESAELTDRFVSTYTQIVENAHAKV